MPPDAPVPPDADGPSRPGVRAGTHDDDHPPAPPASAHARARAAIGFAIGLALFGAAIWAIAHNRANLAESFEAARNAPWWLVASVLLLPAVNWLVVTESFRALNGRYAPVGYLEMSALIGSAWLLNYLPLKPGMFGRIAYHKHVNGIRYADSARVLGFSVSLTGLSLGLLIGVEVMVRLVGSPALSCALPAALLALAAVTLRGRGAWPSRVAYAGLMRYLDSLVFAARYAAAFAVVGEPLSFEDAVLVAIVAQLAFLVPVGNGLGVREWAVRLTTSPVGLLADVVNRAAELAVSVPIGLAGSAWSARRIAAVRRAAAHPPRTGGAPVEAASQPPAPAAAPDGGARAPDADRDAGASGR